MKNIRIFLSENFRFLVVKFSLYLNRHVFIMHLNYRNNHKLGDRQAWANSVDPDQIPHDAASDQGLHCWPLIQQCFRHISR